MKTTITASVGKAENRIEFEVTREQAVKLRRLQTHIRRTREECRVAAKEGRKPRPTDY